LTQEVEPSLVIYTNPHAQKKIGIAYSKQDADEPTSRREVKTYGITYGKQDTDEPTSRLEFEPSLIICSSGPGGIAHCKQEAGKPTSRRRTKAEPSIRTLALALSGPCRVGCGRLPAIGI
jgi:hypothetical protein